MPRPAECDEALGMGVDGGWIGKQLEVQGLSRGVVDQLAAGRRSGETGGTGGMMEGVSRSVPAACQVAGWRS